MADQKPQSNKAGDYSNFAEVLAAAQGNVSNNWEENFVSGDGGMSEKYEKYGAKMFISSKQAEILSRIADIELELAPTPPPTVKRPEPEELEDDEIPF